MKIDLDRFRGAFLEEAAEHLAAMEAGILVLENTPEDAGVINDVFRAAHSLKGGSSTFGFEDIARFTHLLESVLDRAREGELLLETAHISLLLRSTDVLRDLLDAAGDGSGAPPEADGIIEELVALVDAGEGSAPLGAAPKRSGRSVPEETPGAQPDGARRVRVTFRPGPDLFRYGLDPLLALRDLAELGEVSGVAPLTDSLPTLEELEPETAYLGWTAELVTERSDDEIFEGFVFFEGLCDIAVHPIDTEPGGQSATAAPAPPTGSQAASGRGTALSSIRVDTRKVDELVDLVGELSIAQSRVSALVEDFTIRSLPDLQEAVEILERNTRDLQERVLSARMVPVGTVFGRIPRMVRDLAAELGKDVSLDFSGDDVELDKGVVEHLQDPLMHLVRNAVDHGLESPSERAAAGKPATGHLRIAAAYENGAVVIQVSDDGGGLDAVRIRAKAEQAGLLRRADTRTDEQLFSLIFEPGFSTAGTVTSVSGRGVGLDVVRRGIESLNGSVGIDSRRGEGTAFRVRLPLTLAMLDGLSLRLGEETLILPILSIVESLRPDPGEIETLQGRGEVVMVHGHPHPLLRLGHLLGLETERSDPSQGIVVLVDHAGQSAGLLVDEVLGQQQVVVKNLEAHYRRVEGVMGATILGSGRAALILDVPGLLRLAVPNSTDETEGRDAALPAAS